MAAGGVMHLLGGSAKEIANAAALALKNLLGLACDPVAGLVEVPCVKRNVIGAVNALTSADLTRAGIFSKIPPDEVSMRCEALEEACPKISGRQERWTCRNTTGVEIRERMSGAERRNKRGMFKATHITI